MKKTIYIFLILILIGWTGITLLKKDKTIENPDIKNYKNSSMGIYFSYPKILSASTTDGIITLSHDIPYQNHGDCDMMGDEKVYDRLTDFKMTIQIINKNLTDTVRTLSPYIPQENFVNDELIASPGFIDPYSLGNFVGFAIYEGVEGCGQTTYYFSVKKDKTLVVQNASIQALSSTIIKEKVDEVLAVPGVVSREKNKEIFEFILNSMKI